MRVTQGLTYDSSVYNLQQGRDRLNRLNDQISSGKIVARPSDNPQDARQILDMENVLKGGDQYLSNIARGNVWLEFAGNALEGMSKTLAQVKNTASGVASSTDINLQNDAMAMLQQFKSMLVDYGNTDAAGQYIFAGFKNDTPPFDAAGTYSGTDDAMKIEVGAGSQVKVNLSGGDLLRGGAPPGSSGVDLLGTIDTLIADIGANNTAGVQAGIKTLDTASRQLIDAVNVVGGMKLRLQSAENIIKTNQSTLQTAISAKQDVDLIKAGTALTAQKTAFEAALSTTATINQLSLLDYLR